MKLGQNVCLDEISDVFENWSGQVKNWVSRSNLRKTLCKSKGHIFSQIMVKLGQNVCLDVILDEFENRLCRVKN